MRLKRFVVGACLLVSVGCRPGIAQDGSSPAKPPSQQEQVTHKNPVVIPKMAKPAPLEAYTDPTFGTKITRISGAAPGQVVKPMYNTVQSWNADESLLLLYHTGAGGPGHHLYDGETYAYRRALDISPRDLEEVYWDTGDPNLFYYLSLEAETYGTLIRYHVGTDEKEVLRDFAGLCEDGGVPKGGNDPQMTSWDSDLLGLRCPSEPYRTFFYSVLTDTISRALTTGEGTPYAGFYALSPAPSGERLFLEGDVLSRNLSLERPLDVTRYDDGSFKPEHAVIGRLADGHDAYFSVIFTQPPGGCEGDPEGGVGALVAYLRPGNGFVPRRGRAE